MGNNHQGRIECTFECWLLLVYLSTIFFQIYPESSEYLNKATKQIDVDILDNDGNKIPVSHLSKNIQIVMERLPHKDPSTVSAPSGFTNLTNYT